MALLDTRQLATELQRFATERDWQQFHSPKNLVMALAVEVSELMEPFQWLSPEQAAAIMAHPDSAAAVRDELADVMIYLVRLADVLHVDLADAVERKIDKNTVKYPPAQRRT